MNAAPLNTGTTTDSSGARLSSSVPPMTAAPGGTEPSGRDAHHYPESGRESKGMRPPPLAFSDQPSAVSFESTFGKAERIQVFLG
jgi:hypothetical protein